MVTTGTAEERLRRAIVDLLRQRGHGSSICPSDAARTAVLDSERWRDLMPTARDVAARLVEEGVVVVTQGDREVDVREARGPVRIRLPR